MAAKGRQSSSSFEPDIRAGRIREGMTFREKVWALTARIPRGRVTTYGRIAEALGSKGCRAVGAALGANPFAPGVPCHRVVGSDGRLTGFAGGLAKKARLLQEEGVPVLRGQRVAVDAPFDVAGREGR